MTEIHGRQPVVLLVDDEPMVTQAQALFLELESEYEVGLYQYLEKPLENEAFLLALKNALAHKGVRAALHDKIQELDRALRQRDELSEREDEIRREMEWAATVQARFLPREIPAAGPYSLAVVYRPAMAVGGDFYEFVPLAGGHLGVIVADSAGHGVQAALGTALLKFATSGLAGQDLGPGDILTRMNEVLFKGLPREIPVAAGVAVIEPETGRIRLAGAGLPHPGLVTGQGDLQFQSAAGLLLGLMDGPMYTPGKESVLTVEKGCSLLLFSDGLTESQNAADELYGEGRLREDVATLAGTSGQALLDELTERALAFGLPEYRDDLTVLGLTRID
jgi:sigma-B regulation protein RsbU (phosphoserine phosphatase)